MLCLYVYWFNASRPISWRILIQLLSLTLMKHAIIYIFSSQICTKGWAFRTMFYGRQTLLEQLPTSYTFTGGKTPAQRAVGGNSQCPASHLSQTYKCMMTLFLSPYWHLHWDIYFPLWDYAWQGPDSIFVEGNWFPFCQYEYIDSRDPDQFITFEMVTTCGEAEEWESPPHGNSSRKQPFHCKTQNNPSEMLII